MVRNGGITPGLTTVALGEMVNLPGSSGQHHGPGPGEWDFDLVKGPREDAVSSPLVGGHLLQLCLVLRAVGLKTLHRWGGEDDTGAAVGK